MLIHQYFQDYDDDTTDVLSKFRFISMFSLLSRWWKNLISGMTKLDFVRQQFWATSGGAAPIFLAIKLLDSAVLLYYKVLTWDDTEARSLILYLHFCFVVRSAESIYSLKQGKWSSVWSFHWEIHTSLGLNTLKSSLRGDRTRRSSTSASCPPHCCRRARRCRWQCWRCWGAPSWWRRWWWPWSTSCLSSFFSPFVEIFCEKRDSRCSVDPDTDRL